VLPLMINKEEAAAGRVARGVVDAAEAAFDRGIRRSLRDIRRRDQRRGERL